MTTNPSHSDPVAREHSLASDKNNNNDTFTMTTEVGTNVINLVFIC